MSIKYLLTIAVIFMSIYFKANSQEALSIDYINEISKEVLLKDQAIRKEYNSCTSDEEREILLGKMNQIDSCNQSIMIPIIELISKGEIKDFNDDVWRASFLIIQHASLEVQLKYKTFITSYFEKGFIKNYEYLVYMDRLHVKSNKAQIFGSQVGELPNGKFLIFPTISQQKRDSAFYSIGMNPNLFKVVNGSMRYGKSIHEYKLEANSDIQYNPLEVENDEFAIIGFITFDKINGLENIIVKYDKQAVTTDSNGVFSFKVKKNNIPKCLVLNHKDQIDSIAISKNQRNGDFLFVKHLFPMFTE